VADPQADLDLRGTPCPLNFIRTRLALEKIPLGAALVVDLDRGEPEQMVVEGLRGEGHRVSVGPHPGSFDAVRLGITRLGTPGDAITGHAITGHGG
jgi:TusA-related sulfurtransferase